MKCIFLLSPDLKTQPEEHLNKSMSLALPYPEYQTRLTQRFLPPSCRWVGAHAAEWVSREGGISTMVEPKGNDTFGLERG